MSEQYTELAKIWMDKWNILSLDFGRLKMMNGIYMIDEMSVNIAVDLWKHGAIYYIGVHIKLNNRSEDEYDVYYELLDKTTDFTEEFLASAIKKLFNNLDTLKFDIVIGQFMLPNEFQERAAVRNIFGKFENSDICPICHEMTRTKLKYCNHYLCHRCFNNEKFDSKCPQCRACTNCGEDCEC